MTALSETETGRRFIRHESRSSLRPGGIHLIIALLFSIMQTCSYTAQAASACQTMGSFIDQELKTGSLTKNGDIYFANIRRKKSKAVVSYRALPDGSFKINIEAIGAKIALTADRTIIYEPDQVVNNNLNHSYIFRQAFFNKTYTTYVSYIYDEYRINVDIYVDSALTNQCK